MKKTGIIEISKNIKKEAKSSEKKQPMSPIFVSNIKFMYVERSFFATLCAISKDTKVIIKAVKIAKRFETELDPSDKFKFPTILHCKIMISF